MGGKKGHVSLCVCVLCVVCKPRPFAGQSPASFLWKNSLAERRAKSEAWTKCFGKYSTKGWLHLFNIILYNYIIYSQDALISEVEEHLRFGFGFGSAPPWVLVQFFMPQLRAVCCVYLFCILPFLLAILVHLNICQISEKVASSWGAKPCSVPFTAWPDPVLWLQPKFKQRMHKSEASREDGIN